MRRYAIAYAVLLWALLPGCLVAQERWLRGKVVSHCGSFVNIRGGHSYPWLIRRAEPKALRVFLQTGTRDLDVVFGNWPLANQEMAAALAYRAYDYQLVIGDGGHTLKHGGAIFPDTMRWLWRDYPARG